MFQIFISRISLPNPRFFGESWVVLQSNKTSIMAMSEAHFFQVVLYLICRECRHVFESCFRCLFHRPWLGDGEGVYRGTERRFPSKYIENTFPAIQSTFRSLEMHSKRSFKICIFFVILGELESFRNYKGFSIIFPKILDAI